ncbi:iron-sulfur cluster assembly scaffold protein [Novosphingobium sp. KCTC 2891]|uniref:iron-sulfur cluster assembly scaffold protein n=1 Tax=Novosphingobium sp. KCTC 2891 TaxID=2989730 RepID=UPI00222285AD|nr:iron-sulfur cluster assembly scaffold protein [Novosphingobium sp. KCTC 2891]MCW1383380.1 iron-sulfur cluster assembly scaffold protein [Novosphingobium sp. KCTC 2891]
MAAPARALYTPAMLSAAAGLAAFPWDEALPLRGEARSRSCGSSIVLGLSIDDMGRVAGIGIRPHACAVGQAAAHAFAGGATGRTRDNIAATRQALALWLSGEGTMPDWPGLGLLEPALDYPGRHPAILLAWDAALSALPS